MSTIGFGPQSYRLAFCIANRPPIDDYPVLDQLRPLAPAEIDYIVSNTSNHWRKVFNVYAKFLFELRGDQNVVSTWQNYRDRHLLQAGSDEALLFNAPMFSSHSDEIVHVIAGKTYATALKLPFSLTWIDSYFAINVEYRVIVSPYLDYRQLSNERISILVRLVKSLLTRDATLLCASECETLL